MNFSAHGTRWRVTAVDGETAREPHIPPLPGPGLLFTSVNAELRFLAMDEEILPTVDDLEGWSVADLSGLLKLAKPFRQ